MCIWCKNNSKSSLSHFWLPSFLLSCLVRMPILNIFSVLRYSRLPPPHMLGVHYQSSNSSGSSFKMSPKPDPFFKVSPLPLMPASPPWRQPPKPCPVSWLMSMTQARQTGQQGSRFPGPKALAAPRSVEGGHCRKVLRTRLPVVQATSSP